MRFLRLDGQCFWSKDMKMVKFPIFHLFPSLTILSPVFPFISEVHLEMKLKAC